MDLTDKQWALIEPLFETKGVPTAVARRPRDVFNGVLWVLPHRRAVERLARPLSAVSNIPSRFQLWLSAIATLGRPARLARISRRAFSVSEYFGNQIFSEYQPSIIGLLILFHLEHFLGTRFSESHERRSPN